MVPPANARQGFVLWDGCTTVMDDFQETELVLASSVSPRRRTLPRGIDFCRCSLCLFIHSNAQTWKTRK